MERKEIETFLKYYLKLGIKPTIVDSSINDSNNPLLQEQIGSYLKTETIKINSIEDFYKLNIDNRIFGIGISLENNNLICLDIDYSFSDLCIKDILSVLGLPENYEWVIKTGSGFGFHIILDCKSLDIFSEKVDLSDFDKIRKKIPMKSLRESSDSCCLSEIVHLLSIPNFNPEIDYKYLLANPPGNDYLGNPQVWSSLYHIDNTQELAKKIISIRINIKHQDQFEKLQIMNDKHCLLPLSVHKTGNVYKFFNNDLPHSYPKTINSKSLLKLINEFCVDDNVLKKLRDYEVGVESQKFQFYYGHDLKLIIDFETTGLCNNIDYYDIENFPEIIQVAWIITDGEDIIYSESALNSDITNEIPEGIVKLTGINNDMCINVGRPLNVISEMILSDLKKVKKIIGYNLDFDLKVLKNLLFRTSKPYNLNTIPQQCLMNDAFAIRSKIEGYNKSSWLKLSDLFLLICPNSSIAAHNAASDVLMTYKIYKKIQNVL